MERRRGNAAIEWWRGIVAMAVGRCDGGDAQTINEKDLPEAETD